MKQGWRWFGPDDPVSLDDVRQAGATEIVSALHNSAPSKVWTVAEVEERRHIIETTKPGQSALYWTVIESIPVPDDVRRKGRAAKASIQQWLASMEAVAKGGGPKIICYNFMPVLDWTRTDLDWVTPTGATALRYEHDKLAAFDLHILKRDGAEADYDAATRARAARIVEGLSQAELDQLVPTITAGLPGTTTDTLPIDQLRERLQLYKGLGKVNIRQHLIEFLEEVCPVAEKLGMKLTLHPDDPPRPVLGLPRIASNAEDYQALFDAVPSPANGICLCTGSLGVSKTNDLVSMAKQFAPRIYFAHLRATRREGDTQNFHEADHLDGDVDMIGVIHALMSENRKRAKGEEIIFRPDHGHRMLDDLGKKVNPGYSAIGRLRGLAEIRGAMRAIDRYASF